MSIKLWVDDLRACPPGYVHCRTVTEAIRMLDCLDVVMVSLDHDICHPEPIPDSVLVTQRPCLETYEPVARFIANNPGAVKHVHFQTSNPAGAERMANIIGTRQPGIRLTAAVGRSYEETQDAVIG